MYISGIELGEQSQQSQRYVRGVTNEQTPNKRRNMNERVNEGSDWVRFRLCVIVT